MGLVLVFVDLPRVWGLKAPFLTGMVGEKKLHASESRPLYWEGCEVKISDMVGGFDWIHRVVSDGKTDQV